MIEWPREDLTSLNWILANLYPTVADSRRIAADSGLKTIQIEFNNQALTNWFNILDHANARGKVSNILNRAIEENPEDESLQRASGGAPPPVLQGPETQQWRGPAAAASLEKIIGQKSTLVPISYLEIGLQRARCVVRVKRQDGSSGTGFVTANNILITNNHVLPRADIARSSVVQFNYQHTIEGLNAPIEEANLLPDLFFRTSADDDWSAVKIDGDVIAKWGALPLAGSKLQIGDHVNIIQHPGGGPKQISLSANVIVFVGAGRVQYLTDTLPGSSGSPVFDADWNVVALHHSGGWLIEPNASSKTAYYRNEGISIDRVIAGLSA